MAENRLQAKGFLVWGICALFFLYEFFLRTVLGTYQHPVIQDLNLTSFQFSLLSTTVFLMVYGLMQIPVGLIVDHIGLKKSLIIGAVSCTISSFGFAYSYSYPVAVFFRLVMGFGASFGFICLLMSVHEWMPHKYSAIFIGLSQFIGTLGPMLAAGPLDNISNSTAISWRLIFLCLSGIGILLTLLILFFVENNQQTAGRYVILYKPEKVSKSFLRVCSQLQPWYIAFVSASLFFTVEYLSENEGRTFLALKGISVSSAAYMITTAWIGYAVGCPIIGFISDMLERRKICLSVSAFITLIAILIILYSPVKLYLQIGFFLLGVGAAGQSIGFATMAEQFKKQFVAVGFGLNNAVLTIVSAVNAPLIGLLLDWKGGRFISLSDYLIVFNVLILIAFVGLILALFFVKETYCKSSAEFTVLETKN